MNDKKYTYEAPETQVVELNTEGAVLTGSDTSANRDNYGSPTHYDW